MDEMATCIDLGLSTPYTDEEKGKRLTDNLLLLCTSFDSSTYSVSATPVYSPVCSVERSNFSLPGPILQGAMFEANHDA